MLEYAQFLCLILGLGLGHLFYFGLLEGLERLREVSRSLWALQVWCFCYRGGLRGLGRLQLWPLRQRWGRFAHLYWRLTVLSFARNLTFFLWLREISGPLLKQGLLSRIFENILLLAHTGITPLSDLLDGIELFLNLFKELIALLLDCKSWNLVAKRIIFLILLISTHQRLE